MSEKDLICPYCNEMNDNWDDNFEGVKHYKEFEPQDESDPRFFHRGTHIYVTNNRAILDVENFRYLIRYCPFCGRKLIKNDLQR